MTAPQKEHCDHECVCGEYEIYASKGREHLLESCGGTCYHDTRSNPAPSSQCPHWVSSTNLKSDCRDQGIGRFYCNKSMYEHDTTIRIDSRNELIKEIESGILTYEKEHQHKQVMDSCCGIYIPINVVRRLLAFRKIPVGWS